MESVTVKFKAELTTVTCDKLTSLVLVTRNQKVTQTDKGEIEEMATK